MPPELPDLDTWVRETMVDVRKNYWRQHWKGEVSEIVAIAVFVGTVVWIFTLLDLSLGWLVAAVLVGGGWAWGGYFAVENQEHNEWLREPKGIEPWLGAAIGALITLAGVLVTVALT